MSRHQRRRRKRDDSLLLPQGANASALRTTMAAYIEWTGVQSYTPTTVRSRAEALGLFAQWCESRSLTAPQEVTRPILERYQRWLFHYRKKNGRPLGTGTQYGRLLAVKGYFKWLTRSGQLLHNPASELDMPRRGRVVLPYVLSSEETEAILVLPKLDGPSGLRDRAMMETLYSTGMRRMELCGLSVYSVRAEHGTVTIRQGKGRKDRIVPIGERALVWVAKYLADGRPKLAVEPDPGNLFLSELGAPLNPNRLTTLVRGYVQASGVAPRGACHLFRHVMATQMLENGADVRFVQEMLGHSSLEATQVYTHVSIRKLKEIHAATHPAAALARCRGGEDGDAGDQVAAELLSSLAAEVEADREE